MYETFRFASEFFNFAIRDPAGDVGIWESDSRRSVASLTGTVAERFFIDCWVVQPAVRVTQSFVEGGDFGFDACEELDVLERSENLFPMQWQ